MEHITNSFIIAFIIVIAVNIPFMSIRLMTKVGAWVAAMSQQVGVWYIYVPSALSIIFYVGLFTYDWKGALAGTVVTWLAYIVPVIRKRLLAATYAFNQQILAGWK